MRETLDEVLRYALRLDRASIGTARRMVEAISAAIAEVEAALLAKGDEESFTADRLRRLRVELRKVAAALAAKLGDDLEEALSAVRDTTATLSERLVEDMRKAAGAGVSLNSVAVPVESVIATATAEFRGRAYRWWTDRLAADVLDRIEIELRKSLVLGETTGQAVRRLRLVDGLGRRSAVSLARTGLTTAATEGRLAAVRSLAPDLGLSWRYVATLDSRTSILCASLDSKVWRDGDPALRRPALHPHCRSTLVPLVDGQGGEPVQLAGERASVDGPVSARLDFEQWLRRQPDSFVDEFLGPTRADLWRAGMPLSDMIDGERELSLAELRARYAGRAE